MATNDIDVGMYVLELRPRGTVHMLHLLSPLNTDHAIGIHRTASLPNHGRLSMWANSIEV